MSDLTSNVWVVVDKRTNKAVTTLEHSSTFEYAFDNNHVAYKLIPAIQSTTVDYIDYGYPIGSERLEVTEFEAEETINW